MGGKPDGRTLMVVESTDTTSLTTCCNSFVRVCAERVDKFTKPHRQKRSDVINSASRHKFSGETFHTLRVQVVLDLEIWSSLVAIALML